MQIPAQNIITIAVLSLVAWRVYGRFRRMVGRQRLSRIRPVITIVVFTSLICVVGWFTLIHPERLPWLVAGVGAGVGLAVYGLRLTQFEPTREGLFYTPNAHLGIALSLLFVGRILYRLAEVYTFQTAAPGASDFVRSPVTLSIFGLLAGYYVAYAVGLVRWRREVMRAKRERETAANDP